MIPEFIKVFFEQQLNSWDEAKINYDALSGVKKRTILTHPYTILVQYNPGRIISTSADISLKAIEDRKCFLCRNNRSNKQEALEIFSGFDLLVNPYPIFPYHFTISSIKHRPQIQGEKELKDMADMAVRLNGMTVFFNGLSAGASAPDHLHFQAVPKKYIPLIEYIEKKGDCDISDNFIFKNYGPNLFFKFYSGKIESYQIQNKDIYIELIKKRGGVKEDNLSLLNIFFWLDFKQQLRYLLIPRLTHRPSCYYASGKENILVSPGAIDMAGVIILPREQDFERITERDIIKIYKETGLQN